MKVRSIVILLVIGLFILSACSSGKSARHSPQAVFQPDWYGMQGDSEYVFTYGQSVNVSQNASEKAAYANAMQEAAQYVETHVQSMIKNYIEEAGVEDPQVLALTSSVARVVANANFSGTQIARRETFVLDNGRYQTFIRVSIPQNEVNRTLRNQIRNEEALYNQFKASQAFDELDKVLERQ
jgi:hypothetical protein